ncbi:MAG: right-handed parallel beta-helix repeat-containing protein [Thermoleophilia bacterium]
METFTTKTSRNAGWPIIFLAALFVFLVFESDIEASGPPILPTYAWILRDDATGGDCASVASWDPTTKTCTLTEDLNSQDAGGFLLADDGITLDGDGHTISGIAGSSTETGVSTATYGFYSPSQFANQVTIRNLRVINFSRGIEFNTSNSRLTGNDIGNNIWTGVNITASDSEVDNNNIHDNRVGMSVALNRVNVHDNAMQNNQYGLILTILAQLPAGQAVVKANTMMANQRNFAIDGAGTSSGGLDISGNVVQPPPEALDNIIDTTNLADGKPIFYLHDLSGSIIDASPASSVYCFNCNRVRIYGLTASHNQYAVSLFNTRDSLIEDISATATDRAISLLSSTGNTIRNSTIADSAWAGISLSFSDNNRVAANTLLVGTIDTGIQLINNSNSNIVQANSISGSNFNSGIAIGSSSNNLVQGNQISDLADGITIGSSSANIVRNNEISYSTSCGINLLGALDSHIYNNIFSLNATQICRGIYPGTDSGNIFSLPLPVGGNWWDSFNTPAQGCNDINGEQICDSPYSFTFAADSLPWVAPGLWPDTIPPIVTAIAPNGESHLPLTSISVDYADVGSSVNAAAVTVTLDGQALAGCTATATSVSCPLTLTVAGDHTIGGFIYDNAGNVTAIEGSFQAVRDYYYSWYDGIGGSQWLFAYATSMTSANISLSLAGNTMTTVDIPGSFLSNSFTSSFPGLRGGPVKLKVLNGETQRVASSERILWAGKGFEEIQATPEDRLSDHYYWPWYDQQTPGYRDWVVIANPDSLFPLMADVTIGGDVKWSGLIAPGATAVSNFPDVMGGPVEVHAWREGGDWATEADRRPVIASQRVLTNDGTSLNELPGIAANDLSETYQWTWYDNVGGSDWMMMANPGQDDVHASISVAGQQVWSEAIAAGSVATECLPGLRGGPVELSADGKLVATQRVLWGPSLDEAPGRLPEAVTPGYHEYTWSWYDQNTPGVTDWVLIYNPDPVNVLYVGLDVGSHTQLWHGEIPPLGIATPTIPGELGGPLKLGGSGPMLASQRVLWNGYFNEVAPFRQP